MGLLLSFFILFSASLQAQKTKKPTEKKLTGYYRTYEDYLNKNLVVKDEISGRQHYFAVFKKAGEKEKVKYSEIWGFLYKGELFRIDKHFENRQVATRVIEVGNIVYYENGWAHLQMLENNTNEGEYSAGYMAYISNDLNSEMTPLPVTRGDAKSMYKKFMEKNPQHAKLYDCIDKSRTMDVMRQCTEEYNRTDSKGSK